jgi:hypothetical protein
MVTVVNGGPQAQNLESEEGALGRCFAIVNCEEAHLDYYDMDLDDFESASTAGELRDKLIVLLWHLKTVMMLWSLSLAWMSRILFH